MGIIRRVVIGSLAVGAARLAMQNKEVQRTAKRLTKRVREAAEEEIGEAVERTTHQTARSAKRVVRKVKAAAVSTKRKAAR